MAARIQDIHPRAGVEGGRVIIAGEDLCPAGGDPPRLRFGGVEARPLIARANRIVVPVPPGPASGPIAVQVNGTLLAEQGFAAAVKLAADLHPVTNPAIAPDGTIVTTFSGTRGQQVPVSVFRITPQGASSPLVSDLVNPTGLAFAPDGTLYISSRMEGNVYRVTPAGETQVFARGLGIATGIVFDRQGNLFVGDRSGVIYRVDPVGAAQPFATLPPSIAAYHLALGSSEDLFVAAPTLSNDDPIYWIGRQGAVKRFVTGLARPQGLAFDGPDLFAVAGRGGERGVFRISPRGSLTLQVAAENLVGLAFDGRGGLVLATTSAIYRLPWPTG